MTLREKCEAYGTVRGMLAVGIYPYFTPVEAATATEVLARGKWRIMVGSNNYLGLTHHPRILEAQRAALDKYGSGATGSRVLNGTIDLHDRLEARFADFYRKDAALVFTTGYQASLGVVAGFAGRNDHIFLDRVDHASIVDGARMSPAKLHRYPHGDFDALDRALAATDRSSLRLVVSDGVFSMDGDIVDLPRLCEVVKRHDATLVIDDAHALGVIGEDGAGTARHFGMDDDVDFVMATFSKSLASVGGVVAGPGWAIEYLRHNARSLIFTASAPPASVAGALAALEVMVDEPERRERLWENTRRVVDGLRSLGFDLGRTETAIIPVHLGPARLALEVWQALFDDGVFAHAVQPPAVPSHACRIRVSMTAEHTPEQVTRVLEAFEKVAKKLDLAPQSTPV
jgi:8-amino-7-oxononanoate synthase